MTKARDTALLEATDGLGQPFPGAKDVALVPREQALPAPQDGLDLTMFERLVKDPAVDPDKLERLMTLAERAQLKAAERAFDGAMARGQAQMKRVAQDADNPQTKSRYASYAALDRALRPIYTEHGFALSFDTADLDPALQMVRVICHVSHQDGYRRDYHIDMPADGKGAKGGDVMTRTHATGSAISYGMRYLLRMIFNVAVGHEDDDGNAASGSRTAAPSPEPAGFEAWWDGMRSVADEGIGRLEAEWKRSPRECQQHVRQHMAKAWDALKKRAEGR